VILAEVEVPSEGTVVPIPDWIGREVTGRPEYKKLNMVRARTGPTAAPANIGNGHGTGVGGKLS